LEKKKSQDPNRKGDSAHEKLLYPYHRGPLGMISLIQARECGGGKETLFRKKQGIGERLRGHTGSGQLSKMRNS